MRTASRRGVVLAVGSMLVTGIAQAATHEKIGSWELSCPGEAAGAEPCRLRFDKRFFDKGGVSGDLEVQAQGTSLVPVLALRGVAPELLMAAALAGTTTEASMRFGGGAWEALTCGTTSAGYLCWPGDDAARNLAAELPAARSVTVRVSVAVPGLKPLPVQEKSLDLIGTNEALARLRAAGPSQVPGPMAARVSQSPAALMGMADKALKAAGYPNGVADLQGLVGKYMKK
jgi:hypothetical protein